MNNSPNPRAIFGARKDVVSDVLDLGKKVHSGFLANTTYLPSPPVLMPLFGTQVQDLDTSEIATRAGTHGTTATRDRLRDVVWASLGNLKHYAQTCADADPPHAVEIITASGFALASATTRTLALLTLALKTGVPGCIHARVNAAMLHGKLTQKVTYLWQVSVNGGHTWLPTVATPVTVADLVGLPLHIEASVRVSAVTRTGTFNWSDPATIFIH